MACRVFERDYVCKKYSFQTIEVPIRLRHDVIIDALLQCIDSPFWLVDHDCYVFNKNLITIDVINKNENHCGISYYGFKSKYDGQSLPHTFLLSFNPKYLRTLMHEFNVSSKVYYWKDIPKAICAFLEKRGGIQLGSYPQDGHAYFDTLRLLSVIAKLDGSGFQILDTPDEDSVFHAGNCSRPEWLLMEDHYHALGAYFWKSCLNKFPDLMTHPAYSSKSKNLPELDEMEAILNGRGKKESVEQIKYIIKKILK